MPSVAAIVLAAGSSLRLGTPKQLVHLGAETLLERTARVALQANLDPVVVVVSPILATIAAPSKTVLVINHEATEGMASSIRAGVRALVNYNPTGAILIAVDQPAVTAEHLRTLANGAGVPLASAYAGRKGIPAYFPDHAFATLLALHGDAGARTLLQNAEALSLPGGELDVDTAQDLEQARKLYPI